MERDWASLGMAQMNEKQMFDSILLRLCSTIRTPKSKGRPNVPWPDLMFIVASEIYHNKSNRGYESIVKDLKENGLIEKPCTHQTISNFLNREEVSKILEEMITKTSLPLAPYIRDFAVDSTGISTDQYTSYFRIIYMKEGKRKDWAKLHLCVDVEFNMITALDITGQGSDTPYLIPLLEKTRRSGFSIGKVMADKAYWSNAHFDYIEGLGGKLFVEPRSNSRRSPRHSRGMNEAIDFHEDQDWLKEYHKRSNVEAVFSSMKRRFGGFVRGRTETSKKNEILLKCLCHNICMLIKFYARMKGPVLL